MENENNIKNTEVNLFLAKIHNVIKTLDEIDEIISNQPQKIQKVDYMISDYLHLIQHELLGVNSQHNVCDKIKELRIKREDLNNLNILCKTYEQIRQKLPNANTRKFIYSEFNKTIKNFNQPYNYRVLTNEEVENYIKNNDDVDKKDVVKKRQYTTDEKITKEILTEELKSKSVSEITKEHNVTRSHIYYLISKYKISR